MEWLWFSAADSSRTIIYHFWWHFNLQLISLVSQVMQNSLAQLNLYLEFYMINIVISICYTRYDDTIQIKIYQQTIAANYYDQTITVVDWYKKKKKKMKERFWSTILNGCTESKVTEKYLLNDRNDAEKWSILPVTTTII